MQPLTREVPTIRNDVMPLLHEPWARARLQPLSLPAGSVRTLEISALVFFGALAACLSTFIDLKLRIPGHRILFAVLPLAAGFALVPRRGAGTVMGAAALATIGVFWVGGLRVVGIGALASLTLTGPLLDLALRWGRTGTRLYLAFVLAGTTSNVVAFLVRGSAKVVALQGMGGGGGGGRGNGSGAGLGRSLAGGRPLADWLPNAVWTYALAGILAGLVSALVWFHLRARRSLDGT